MARRFHQAHDIFEDRVVKMYGFADGTHAQHVVAGEHRMHGGCTVGDVDLFENAHAHVVAWIADGCFDEETIHLRFRQFVGAELFYGVLGGDDHERLRQRNALAPDGGGSFGHGFKHGRLCFRVRTVDFVEQHEIGVDGSDLRGELLCGEIEDLGAHQI